MEIAADKVKELRERTGAGIMDCKRALASTGGDLAQAADFLRKEGTVKAAKKAGRETLEGLIGEALSPDGSTAALVELNCETDFVARTDDFTKFLKKLSQQVLQKGNPDGLREELLALIAKLGENMGIRRFARLSAAKGEVLGLYLHTGSKIGAIVCLKGNGASAGAAREVAMHVAAMHPRYLNRKQVPPEALAREKEIVRALPEITAKPENLRDRIVEGKILRFFSEVCLVEQPFIRDPSGKKNVGAFLQETLPGVEVSQFVRLQVGEEIH